MASGSTAGPPPANGSTVAFADGTAMTVRTAIWATGFTLDHSWIDVPVFDAAHIAAQIRVRSTGAHPMSGSPAGGRLVA